jgi:ABC-2 type transport system permease protein
MVLLFGLPIFLAYGIVYHAPLIFYGLCLVVFIPFLLIASCIGVFITMVLVNFFPARRTRDILFLLSILFIVSLYLLFRFLKPETLVNPENFANLIDYFTALKTISFPLLPSFWATEALFPFLHSNHEKDIGFYILMLWSTGLSLLVIGNWLASRIYFNGWSKSQESRKLRLSRSSFFNHTIDIITRPFSPSTQVIIEKELKTFFRDTTQWSQLLLLLSLVIVYIYNFKVLPLEKSPIPSFYLQNLFSFLNLGLAGFVLSAIAVRFVFPAVSVEGQAFWLIKTSPLSLKKFLWSKFWMSLIPLLILAEILTVITNYLLKVTDFMMGLSMVTIFFMTFSITSLGIGMGAIYPRFKHGNTAEISSGFGGLMYMIYAIGLIALTIILEARPVYILFMHHFRKLSIPIWFYLEITVAIFLILLINFAAIIFPIHYGLKHLDSMENIE